jgi:hypothetical protein
MREGHADEAQKKPREAEFMVVFGNGAADRYEQHRQKKKGRAYLLRPGFEDTFEGHGVLLFK